MQQQQLHQHHKRLSAAAGLLLMFAEDQDAAVRMAAEEQLHRIVRANEHTASTRLLYDFYYELLKNGHHRSLRCAMQLFAAHMPRIRQRKARAYAVALVPWFAQVARRPETGVLEQLEEFVREFARYLLGALHDNDVRRLVEVFVADTTGECAVRRRCAAQNVCHIVGRTVGRQRAVLARLVLNRALDQLVAVPTTTTTSANLIGGFGLLRVFLPPALGWLCAPDNGGSSAAELAALQQRVCELFELCVHVVCQADFGGAGGSSHSVINAALEVLAVVTGAEAVRQLRLDSVLTSRRQHELMLMRNSTLRQLWQRNATSSSGVGAAAAAAEVATATAGDACAVPDKSTKMDERDVTATSDQPPIPLAPLAIGSTPAQPDSIGSFITSLLSPANTDKVTKFFSKRLASDSVQTSPLASPSSVVRHLNEAAADDNADAVAADADRHSLGNISSSATSRSNLSAAFSELNLSDELPSAALSSPGGSIDFEFAMTTPTDTTPTVRSLAAEPIESAPAPVVSFDVTTTADRLPDMLTSGGRQIAGKFLLAGQRGQLQSDAAVRVSVKNLALQVLCNCVAMRPELLLETVVIGQVANSAQNVRGPESLVASLLSDVLDDVVDSTADSPPQPDMTDGGRQKTVAPDELLIIDDHFGRDQLDVSAAKNVPPEPQMEQSPHLSDISESELMPLAVDAEQPVDTPKTESPVKIATPIIPDSQDAADQQELTDLLLFLVDSDPLLRGNIILLIGHFCDATLRLRRQSVEDLSGGRLSLDQLLQAIFDGLADESHIVVKHALVAVELVLVQLLRWTTPMQFAVPNDDEDRKTAPVKRLVNSASRVHLVEAVLDRLSAVFGNKYWVVQCKYCELIGSMRFDDVEWQLDGDKRHVIEVSTEQFVHRQYRGY